MRSFKFQITTNGFLWFENAARFADAQVAEYISHNMAAKCENIMAGRIVPSNDAPNYEIRDNALRSIGAEIDTSFYAVQEDEAQEAAEGLARGMLHMMAAENAKSDGAANDNRVGTLH